MPPGYVLDEMRMYEIGCLMPFLYLATKDSWEQARLMGYISAQTHSTKKMSNKLDIFEKMQYHKPGLM